MFRIYVLSCDHSCIHIVNITLRTVFTLHTFTFMHCTRSRISLRSSCPVPSFSVRRFLLLSFSFTSGSGVASRQYLKRASPQSPSWNDSDADAVCFLLFRFFFSPIFVLLRWNAALFCAITAATRQYCYTDCKRIKTELLLFNKLAIQSRLELYTNSCESRRKYIHTYIYVSTS